VTQSARFTEACQLLHEIVPKAATIAYLMNPSNPNAEIEMRAAQSAAASLGQQMTIVSASNTRELDAGFVRGAATRPARLLFSVIWLLAFAARAWPPHLMHRTRPQAAALVSWLWRRPSPLRRNISAALWRGRPRSRSRPSQPRRRDPLC
jgi:hypothetical protein